MSVSTSNFLGINVANYKDIIEEELIKRSFQASVLIDDLISSNRSRYNLNNRCARV